MATTGLDIAQRKQVLSSLEASTAIKTLTGEQMLEKLTTEMGNTADAKALLVKSGLITADELEKTQQYKLPLKNLKKPLQTEH